MIIQSITPKHFGAFSSPTRISLGSGVTIFTGQNDSGKSCALAAIEMLCTRTKARESDVNMDRHGHHRGTWNSDSEIQISAVLEITNSSIDKKLVSGSPVPGDVIHCLYQVNNPEIGYRVMSAKRNNGGLPLDSIGVRAMPVLIRFRDDATIGSSIDLKSHNAPESQLLKLAFGPQFSAENLQSLNAHRRSVQLGRAQELINTRLEKFFPRALPFTFRFNEINGASAIAVSLVDSVGGYVPLEMRGSGVRKLLSLMGLLLQEIDPTSHTVVLLDEPENSLHADAQHQLRRVLEGLALNPLIQVIYATHSPSMINSAHPERVRVFSRKASNEIAESTVSSLSHSENFQSARASLGITPADSLLYGLVTVIVEGETEARCLVRLIRRLGDQGVEGFQDSKSLLAVCHFVCGWGDSIPYYCSLAVSQGARPVVFLDGDKQVLARRIRADHPAVPVIEIANGFEFEDTVHRADYIAAVSAVLEVDDVDVSGITEEGYEGWLAGAARVPDRMMFSKKIERWVFDVVGRSFSKPAVMEKAIDSTPLERIDVASVLELIQRIRGIVN